LVGTFIGTLLVLAILELIEQSVLCTFILSSKHLKWLKFHFIILST